MEMALLLSIPCRFNTPCISLSSLSYSSSPFSSSSSSSVQLSTISSSLPRPPCTKRTTLSPSPCLPTLTHNRNSNEPNSDTDTDQQKPPWMRLVLRYVRRLVRLFHGLSLRKRMALFGLLVLSGGALTLLLSRRSFRASKIVPYSDLVNGVRLGHVAAVDFEEGSRSIYFQTIGMQKSENSSLGTKRLRTRKMDRDEKFLLGLLREHGVTYRSVPPPVSRLLLSCIGTIAGLWVGVIPLIWIMERRLHGDAKKKNRTGTRHMVSFDDVQGVDSAKEELIEVVNCLQGTLDYKKLGAKLPTGILLVGPPGTGKTLLARAVAGEADVPFFSVSASEFVELYVGRGAARVRDLFKEARQEAPAVVFIDELDAVGTERDGFSAERDQTLNQLLTEMDGFDSDKQVIVLAATNRPDALDSALLRPGRFSRKVLVGEPDFEGRKRILAVHLRRVPLEEEMEVVCDLVANLTEGFVGADLANIANEAALLAVRRGGSLVTREDIMEAIERENFGVNENKGSAAAGSKRLKKLFPWLPSLAQSSLKSKNRDRNAVGSRRVLSH